MENRKRSANFSTDECEVLTTEVVKRQQLLFGQLAGPLTMAAKASGWEEVAAAVSAVSSLKRSASEVCFLSTLVNINIDSLLVATAH